jgi:hypothetical protein
MVDLTGENKMSLSDAGWVKMHVILVLRAITVVVLCSCCA